MAVTYDLPGNVQDMTIDELDGLIFDLGYAMAEARDIRDKKAPSERIGRRCLDEIVLAS